MWPSVTSMLMGGWLCVLLAGVSTASKLTIYKKVGDEVVLKPDVNSSGTIESIMWKVNANIAIQWDGEEVQPYRQFQERGRLNLSSGELTIINLSGEDSGLYTVELKNTVKGPFELIVISPVPTPTLSQSCDEEGVECILTCDGDTTAAEPVTYNWRLDGSLRTASSKTHTVTKENSLSINEFSCELENPVSKKSSQPIPNPLNTTAATGLKINTGLTVFICLLTVVILLGLIHRWKAGMWFFQKASMPWEADFWRKERPLTGAAESNGTTARLERGQTDEEETQMTLMVNHIETRHL